MIRMFLVNMILLTAWTMVYGVNINLKRKLLQSNTEELKKRVRSIIPAIEAFNIAKIMSPFVEECKREAQAAKKNEPDKTNWTIQDAEMLLQKTRNPFKQNHKEQLDNINAEFIKGDERVKEGKRLINEVNNSQINAIEKTQNF